MMYVCLVCFFYKQKTAYEMRISDWSSDVCSSDLGVFLSIVFIVTYHKINEYAESLGALGRINPVIALWVPYFLTAGLIIWMYHVSAHRPGGQPIGALERIFAQVGKHIGRWVRFGRRKFQQV